MLALLRTVGWIACVVYSTIPAFWLLIHPRAEFWRSRRRSPYRILLPIWIGMWVTVAAITAPWRGVLLYENRWALDSRRRFILRRPCALQTLSQRVQPEPARRIARDPTEPQPPTPGDHRHSRPRAPSRLPRPSLRDAGLERGHRPGSLLGADSIRDHDWCSNDQDGGCGVGEEVRRRIPPVSIQSARGSAKNQDVRDPYERRL